MSPKFIDAVMATCEEQMLDSVEDLANLEEAGKLDSVFKPGIVERIKKALSSPLGASSKRASRAHAVPLPLAPPQPRPAPRTPAFWVVAADIARRRKAAAEDSSGSKKKK